MSVVSGWQSLSCREPTDSHCNTVILVFTVENVEGCHFDARTIQFGRLVPKNDLFVCSFKVQCVAAELC